jgi:hypothetical protein
MRISQHVIVFVVFCLAVCLPLVPIFAGRISVFPPREIAVIQAAEGPESPHLLVAFDLQAIEAGRHVDFAQLLFRGHILANEDTVPAARLEVYPVLTDWEEDAVNWETPWDRPGGDVDTCARMTTWVSTSQADTTAMWLDVTRIVTSWKDGRTPNRGFLVKISDFTPAVIERVDLSSVELKVWDHAVYRP